MLTDIVRLQAYLSRSECSLARRVVEDLNGLRQLRVVSVV